MGLAPITGKLVGFLQPCRAALPQADAKLSILDLVGGHVRVAALAQRRGSVQELLGARHHALAARLVEAAPALGPTVLRNGVGAVKRVVERAPARVGGVERIARVRDRHHELRAGDAGDLIVHVLGADRKILRLGPEIADVAQELLVASRVKGFFGAVAMVRVDAALQLIAQVEQAAVTRREVTHERVQAVPERVRFGASAREGFPFDEVVEDFGYLQAADRDVLHDAVLPRYPVLESPFGT